MKNDFVIILVTCSGPKEARRIAAALVKERLSMCVNIVCGAESRFRWKGKIDKARESILFVKAKSRDFRRIERLVKRLHSYDLPEIMAIPVITGSREYMRWLGGYE